MEKPNNSIVHVLGVGLDAKDGHKRITQAERFSVIGGSEETHDRMSETIIKTFETLSRRGKNIEDVDKSELEEIIRDNTPK